MAWPVIYRMLAAHGKLQRVGSSISVAEEPIATWTPSVREK
jgi:hypothetical protein